MAATHTACLFRCSILLKMSSCVLLLDLPPGTRFQFTSGTLVNNNNNTNICMAHIVNIRAESEAPEVARWRGWLVVVV